MKLRNKKTGEIQVLRFPHNEFDEDDDKQYSLNLLDYRGNEYNYNSLAELNEEWEDYKPVEPLIEKKFRKIIREWSKVNGYTRLIYDKKRDCLHSPYCEFVCISFFRLDVFEELEDRKSYDITELCGEENNDERSE